MNVIISLIDLDTEVWKFPIKFEWKVLNFVLLDTWCDVIQNTEGLLRVNFKVQNQATPLPNIYVATIDCMGWGLKTSDVFGFEGKIKGW